MSHGYYYNKDKMLVSNRIHFWLAYLKTMQKGKLFIISIADIHFMLVNQHDQAFLGHSTEKLVPICSCRLALLDGVECQKMFRLPACHLQNQTNHQMLVLAGSYDEQNHVEYQIANLLVQKFIIQSRSSMKIHKKNDHS